MASIPSIPDHLLIPTATQAAYAQTRVANLPPNKKTKTSFR